MIRLAEDKDTLLVKQMWKICFDDADEFIDLYFEDKYSPPNTLLYLEDDKPIASLQMLPYVIHFYGEAIPFYYLSGLCTLPEYRNRGYMALLIDKSHQVMAERNIPFSILVPADAPLFGYYQKFGYEQVFDQGLEPLPALSNILSSLPNLIAAYPIFRETYCKGDFAVQKSFDDFTSIVKDYTMFGAIGKFNLWGMARVIDILYLLQLYAAKNEGVDFKLNIENVDVNYHICGGRVAVCADNLCDVQVDQRQLCRLLFGYKTTVLDTKIARLFPEHHPVMNFMLE